MKKILVMSLTCALVLQGCGEDSPKNEESKEEKKVAEKTIVKDAKYYSENVSELQPLLEECQNKLQAAKTLEALKPLQKDETCKIAYTAKLAIELGSLDKAVIRQVDGSVWKTRVVDRALQVFPSKSRSKSNNEDSKEAKLSLSDFMKEYKEE